MGHKIIIIDEIPAKPNQTDNLQVEDGGQAIIATIGGNGPEERGVFVRIQSWDETREHAEMNKLLGKKIKVTIETIE